MKQVDVLIPVFNDATTISNTLDSILDQGYSGDYAYNVVVLPNGCTDASAKIAESLIPAFDEHDIVRLSVIEEARPSKIRALNIGLRATSNNVVICGDGDVMFSEMCFDAVAETMEDPKVMVSGAVPHFTVAEQVKSTFLGTVQEVAEIAWSAQLEHVQPFGGMMAFKREAVQQFPEDVGVDDTWLGLYAAHCYGPEAVQIAPDAEFYTDFPLTWMDWMMQRTRWARNDALIAEQFPEFADAISERRRAGMRASCEVDRRTLNIMKTRGISPERLAEYKVFVRMATENATLVPDVVCPSGTWDRQSR